MWLNYTYGQYKQKQTCNTILTPWGKRGGCRGFWRGMTSNSRWDSMPTCRMLLFDYWQRFWRCTTWGRCRMDFQVVTNVLTCVHTLFLLNIRSSVIKTGQQTMILLLDLVDSIWINHRLMHLTCTTTKIDSWFRALIVEFQS